MTRVEFYERGKRSPIATVPNAGGVPSPGQMISIRKVTWMVYSVAWAVDVASPDVYDPDPTLRCNIDLVKP